MTNPPSITVRELRTSDLNEARRLMFRSVDEDFGDSYDPAIHADIDDMLGWYVDRTGPFLLVAEDTASHELLGTAGVRGGGLKPDLSPPRLVERYHDGRTGQLVRVYVLREHRRRGIARALVQAVLHQVATEGHYDRIALHTFRHSPGALAFWQGLGCTLVEDDTDGVSGAVFLEYPFSETSPASA